MANRLTNKTVALPLGDLAREVVLFLPSTSSGGKDRTREGAVALIARRLCGPLTSTLFQYSPAAGEGAMRQLRVAIRTTFRIAAVKLKLTHYQPVGSRRMS